MKKNKFNLIYSAFSLIYGIAGVVRNHEFFTSLSLVETILIVAPLIYIGFKYWASNLIYRYQNDASYKPNKNRRRFHDILIQTSFMIVQPLTLDLMYGCSILLTIEFIDPGVLKPLAQLVVRIADFNSNYIHYPMLWVTAILGLLTIFHILSINMWKGFKKWFGYIKLPLKLAAILVFFVGIDNNIAGNSISWSLRDKEPEYKQGNRYTFNSGTPPKVTEQPERIKQLIDKYAELVAAQFNNIQDLSKDSTNQSAISAEFNLPTLNKCLDDACKEPTITQDLLNGYAESSKSYTVKDKQTVSDFYDNSYTSVNGETFKAPPTFEEDLKSITSDQISFKSFMDILSDKRISIDAEDLTDKQKVIKEMISESLGEITFLKKAGELIPATAIFREAGMDAIKDKISDGFMYLVRKVKLKQIKRSDLNAVLISTYNDFHDKIARPIADVEYSSGLLKDFEKDYSNAITLKKSLCDPKSEIRGDNLKRLVDLFPNDPLTELRKNVALLLEINKDKDAIKSVDVEYLRKFYSYLPKNNPIWDNLNSLEREKYIIIAKKSQSPADWQYLADHYPDLASNPIVQTNIRIFKENQDIENAMHQNNREAWTDYLQKYPTSEIAEEIREKLATNDFSAMNESMAEKIIDRNGSVAGSLIEHSAPSIWEEAGEFLSHIRL